MKLAFVFPGQGSQAIGMMAGFDGHPAIRATFAEASEVLGQNLWALVAELTSFALTDGAAIAATRAALAA